MMAGAAATRLDLEVALRLEVLEQSKKVEGGGALILWKAMQALDFYQRRSTYFSC